MAKRRSKRAKAVKVTENGEENGAVAPITQVDAVPSSNGSNTASGTVGKRPSERKKSAPVQKHTSQRLANRPDKLTKQDVTCPICWSILCEPITLPCNHSLCRLCYLKHTEETSLQCPCCRRRLSIWIRTVSKENNLVDEELWARIQNEFPKLSQARLLGLDSQNVFEETESAENEELLCSPSLLQDSQVFDGTLVENSGEIHSELDQLLEQHRRDLENVRMREETASADLIKQLQDEEAQRRATSEVVENEDLLLARSIQEKFKSEQRLSFMQKKTPQRNLMEEWVIANSPDICELPLLNKTKTLSQQSKNATKLKSSTKKRPNTVGKRRNPSATMAHTSSRVSKASQDVMNKFLSSQPLSPDSSDTTMKDIQQPCCSRTLATYNPNLSAFSPTKASHGRSGIVPSRELLFPIQISSDAVDPTMRNIVDEPRSSFTTPDSIKSEVESHFRPIKSAPKTPPRRRADGSFLPAPKLLRSTPIRPCTSLSVINSMCSPLKSVREAENKTCAILEKRISNDSGRASNDSGSPEIAGVSPSSGKSSGNVASLVQLNQTERGCSSDDYRVTPEEEKSRKRTSTGDSEDDFDKSAISKKVKVEVEDGAFCDPGQIKVNQAMMGPNRIVKTEPLFINLECSQGIITIDEEDEDYVSLEAEALETFKRKAEQERKDRELAKSLQRRWNSNRENTDEQPRNKLRSWLRSQAQPKTK